MKSLTKSKVMMNLGKQLPICNVISIKNPLYILNQIENAQNNYNQYVSSLFSEYETKIIDLVQTVQNFKIVNREYFSTIIFDYLSKLSQEKAIRI